jgi:hypothetical protein
MHQRSFSDLQTNSTNKFYKLIICYIPGTTATVFNALNTRNVRNTDTFPKLTTIVIYLIKYILI